jgi:hypothetical protein
VGPLTLLDRRLVIVTGKGGVGKSTVAAALALAAVERGKRVLVCEVNAQERIAPLLGARPSGPVIAEVRPGLSTINVRPAESMREHGLEVVKFKAVYEAVFENRLMRHFLRLVPSLGELAMLGKMLSEARAEERGRPRWDLVVMDAPSTGHAVQLLRVPGALLGMAPPGPLRSDAHWMRELLLDRRRTALALVTLPEELPVTETIELEEQLRAQVGLTPALLLVNAMPAHRFSPEEAGWLPELVAAPAPLGSAAQAALLQSARSALAERELARARLGLRYPTFLLPLLPSPTWGLAEVHQLSAAMARPAAEGGP